MTAELIAMLVPEAIGLVKSGIQATQAKKLEEQYKRPNYEIPSGYKEALNVSKEMASNSQMPGFENIMREIRDSGADAAYRSTELGDPNSAVFSAGLNQENIADLMAKMGVTGAQMQNQNKQNYVQQLGVMGAQQDKAFKINEMDPYEAAKAAESALRGASFKNLENSMIGVGNAYMMDKYVLNPKDTGGGEVDVESIMKSIYGTTDLAPRTSTNPNIAISQGLELEGNALGGSKQLGLKQREDRYNFYSKPQ